MRTLLLALALLTAPLSIARAAETPAAPTGPDLKGLIAQLHRSNEVAMQLGRLAARRGSSTLVRRYGDRVERDHRDADLRLMKLARRHKLAIEELALDAAQSAVINRLRGLHEERFDRVFLATMEAEHRQEAGRLANVPAFEWDARLLIARLSPVLRQDEDLARYLQNTAL